MYGEQYDLLDAHDVEQEADVLQCLRDFGLAHLATDRADLAEDLELRLLQVFYVEVEHALFADHVRNLPVLLDVRELVRLIGKVFEHIFFETAHHEVAAQTRLKLRQSAALLFDIARRHARRRIEAIAEAFERREVDGLPVQRTGQSVALARTIRERRAGEREQML